MGYMIAMSSCCNCGTMTQYNPLSVPSIRGRWHDGVFHFDPEGHREPLCEPCARRLVAILAEKGQHYTIPRDAYEAVEDI